MHYNAWLTITACGPAIPTNPALQAVPVEHHMATWYSGLLKTPPLLVVIRALYIQLCAYVSAFTHAYIYNEMCSCLNQYMVLYSCTHVHMHVYTYRLLYAVVYVHVYIHVYIYIYIYIYMYSYVAGGKVLAQGRSLEQPDV